MELPQDSGSTQERDILGRFMAVLSPDAPAEQTAEQTEAPQEAQTEELPQETEQVDAAPEQGEADLVEVEVNGKPYRVPQELKNEFMHKADYTRKTQDLAVLQKNAQAFVQQHEVLQRFQEQARQEQQELMQVEAELKRLRNVDVTSLDTETYIKTRAYVDQLRDQKQDLEKALGQKQQQFQREFQEKRSEAVKNAYEFIGRHVKDWTPDSSIERETASYATAFGVPPEALSEIALRHPGFAVMAHKARQFDQLQATKGQAVQKAQKAPPVVKPGAVTDTSSVKARQVKAAREAVKRDGSVDALQNYFLTRGMK